MTAVAPRKPPFGTASTVTAHTAGVRQSSLSNTGSLTQGLYSGCWSLQGPHRPNKKGRDGVPHEKTDPRVVRRLRSTLKPPGNIEHIEQLHHEDEATKWFGVTRDLTGRSVLQESDRYMALMSKYTSTSDSTTCYPQLVSFIGTTNAGKSTLIKMLGSTIRPTSGSGNFRRQWLEVLLMTTCQLRETCICTQIRQRTDSSCQSSMLIVRGSKGESGCHWVQGCGPAPDRVQGRMSCTKAHSFDSVRSSGPLRKSHDVESTPSRRYIPDFSTRFRTAWSSCCGTRRRSSPPCSPSYLIGGSLRWRDQSINLRYPNVSWS